MPKILLVEDESMLLEMYRMAFTGGSFQLELVIALNGKEALEKHVQQLEKKLTTSKQKQNFWISRIHDISKTRKKISLPLNKKILIQELLFPWIENST